MLQWVPSGRRPDLLKTYARTRETCEARELQAVFFIRVLLVEIDLGPIDEREGL